MLKSAEEILLCIITPGQRIHMPQLDNCLFFPLVRYYPKRLSIGLSKLHFQSLLWFVKCSLSSLHLQNKATK